jgi:hypothetical protein
MLYGQPNIIEIILENITIPQPAKFSVQSELSSPCTQQPTTSPDPEPDESSPQPSISLQLVPFGQYQQGNRIKAVKMGQTCNTHMSVHDYQLVTPSGKVDYFAYG